jgi:hypothetical protein
MSSALRYEAEHTCTECGQFGAYAFEGAELCMDCYQQHGSCCAENTNAAFDRSEERDRNSDGQALCDRVISPPLQQPTAAGSRVSAEGEILKLNPNCCYEACPRCSSVRRLREFISRHPQDWRFRLQGPERLMRVARQRE